MIPQPIANIAEICARKSVNNVILSPGSRCAPLTISFVRHPEIEVKTISDERSAAFIALGIAQQIRKPVGLVCTSGSAAYNYAPAVAEAFFQQVPLIIFTADRPPEWIDQHDGQTIRQFDLYHNHIKKSYQLPVSFDHKDAVWHAERIISEAINISKAFPPGPVHINVPLREPLYPQSDEKIKFEKDLKIIEEIHTSSGLREADMLDLFHKIAAFKKVLIVAGQGNKDENLVAILRSMANDFKIPMIAELITNLHQVPQAIKFHDTFLAEETKRSMDLQPELLITFGKSVLSKNLKKFLRKFRPKEHWHLQEAGEVADVFQSLTKVIRVSPSIFLSELIKNKILSDIPPSYFNLWLKSDEEAKSFISSYFNEKTFGEFAAVKVLLDNLPACNLHFANSMAVRYGNLIGLSSENTEIEVYVNRGTSGIDGCNSTAVGSCIASKKMTVLVTGDMAFFYDRNAFWHKYHYPNLRIILLNNHAGGIFRLIDGPAELPELEEFFETHQPLTAKYLAEEYKMDYFICQDQEQTEAHLPRFFTVGGKAKILEIQTRSSQNHQIWKDFKSEFRKIYSR